MRPDHLYDGTVYDNYLDSVKAGTSVMGIGCRTRMHLTDKQVAQIRSEYTGAYGQQSALARRYGVYRQTIGDIVRGESWFY